MVQIKFSVCWRGKVIKTNGKRNTYHFFRPTFCDPPCSPLGQIGKPRSSSFRNDGVQKTVNNYNHFPSWSAVPKSLPPCQDSWSMAWDWNLLKIHVFDRIVSILSLFTGADEVRREMILILVLIFPSLNIVNLIIENSPKIFLVLLTFAHFLLF